MWTADSELVVKFSAGLAASVNIVAVVDNVQHVDRLRVQVRFTLTTTSQGPDLQNILRQT